jgi:hypothetical protein
MFFSLNLKNNVAGSYDHKELNKEISLKPGMYQFCSLQNHENVSGDGRLHQSLF